MIESCHISPVLSLFSFPFLLFCFLCSPSGLYSRDVDLLTVQYKTPGNLLYQMLGTEFLDLCYGKKAE